MPAEIRSGIEFAKADRVSLLGDLYLPKGKGPHPVLLVAPGGGWRRGDKAQLRRWGIHFAEQGISAFIVDYRRAEAGAIWPKNLEDISAALAFLKARGPEHNLDPERIGALGASAGAHLAALAALKDPGVKILVGVYGVYDLMTHWQADLSKNPAPGEDATERMLGTAPFDNPRAYFEASPQRQVTFARNALKVLLIHGDADADILPGQSWAFADTLRQARFQVRTLSVPGAGHFWFSEEAIAPATFSGYVADRLVAFVKQHL